MDVPEIRAMVALQLRRLTDFQHGCRNLAVCARVCKDWHASFMPFLYRALSLAIPARSYFFPSFEALKANCHFVQQFYLTLSSTRNQILQYTVATVRNLTKLEVVANEDRSLGLGAIGWLSLLPLLVNNSGIKELAIGGITHSNCLAHIAKHCTLHLTTLHLENMKFDWSELLDVLINCRGLSKLTCYSCTVNGSKEGWKEVDITSRSATTNITDLTLQDSLGGGNVSLVDWMKVCPRLETLTVRDDSKSGLGPVSQFNPGPQLFSLELDCRLLKDTELTEVLVHCTNLKELILKRTSVTQQVFAALSSHFSSLTSLNLRAQVVLEQWMVGRIFEGCSRLEELYLTEVDLNSLYNTALDDQEDIPWACRDVLKRLCILEIQTSADASLNERFTKRLMDLKKLEEVLTKAIYKGAGKRYTLNPGDVPGDTPEAQFLARLCECKDTENPPKALNSLKMSPRLRFIKNVWPRLQYLCYLRDHDDIYSDDGDYGYVDDDYIGDDYFEDDYYGDDYY
ncbi:hypothetical protein BGZ68_001460 [Mortierella alpina]|nr:hypothetical protein BGZ68_001460 [Mortierella alpina]